MSPWIKICGLTTADAVMAAVDAGADAVGFVFHDRSVRNLSPVNAAALGAGVPRSVLRVAVTRHPSQALVDAILAALAPDVLQTDAADFALLALPATLGRLPVLRSDGTLPQPLPARCLFEGGASGAGERADWSRAAALARRTQLVLAGGLDAGNVAAAMAAVQPFGVDVSSGVESAPGRKDAGRIRDFIAAARAAVPQQISLEPPR